MVIIKIVIIFKMEGIMKRAFCIFLSCILMILLIGGYCTSISAKKNNESSKVDVQKSIAKKLIRFHVLANSDSDEDQALKLKVKDNVISYMAPKLENCKSIDEARSILRNNDNNIINIAQKVIRQNGYNYSVKIDFSNVNFPVKTYGNIVLPEGRYEAYRILIGNAEGHNWWCVMFPPLCFTDITKGEVEEDKTSKEMKNVLTKEEFKEVDNSKEQNNIKVKFKLLEEIQKLIKKISAEIN